MRAGWVKWALAASALALTSCGDTVDFPGIGEDRPSPVTPTPPSEPNAPSDPVSTPDPQDPDGPVDPVEPSPPVEPPTDDTQPDDAQDPVDPPTTDTPTDPDAPSDPDVPTDPDTPTDPVSPSPPADPTFSYYPPGNLIPGSGRGSLSETIFAPDMVFPVQTDPAIPQSQVFSPGGGLGPPGGDQCDPANYEIIWRDNFCETRSRFSSPYCPAGEGVHLGQDIRIGTAADCQELRRREPRQRTLHKIVAVEDGEISNIGRYTVTLKSGGRIYRYLHLNMLALQVSPGEEVEAGDLIGYMSNDFGGTPTTFHLHFEIKVNDGENGWVFAPPYTSLLEAYAEREGNIGEQIEQLVGVASAEEPVIIPEGFVIVE